MKLTFNLEWTSYGEGRDVDEGVTGPSGPLGSIPVTVESSWDAISSVVESILVNDKIRIE